MTKFEREKEGKKERKKQESLKRKEMYVLCSFSLSLCHRRKLLRQGCTVSRCAVLLPLLLPLTNALLGMWRTLAVMEWYHGILMPAIFLLFETHKSLMKKKCFRVQVFLLLEISHLWQFPQAMMEKEGE